jgi:hypothetical protein
MSTSSMAIDLFECAAVPPTAYGIFEDTACLKTSLGMMYGNLREFTLDSGWDLGFGQRLM